MQAVWPSPHEWPEVARRMCNDSLRLLQRRMIDEIGRLKMELDKHDERVSAVREWQKKSLDCLVELRSYMSHKMDPQIMKTYEYIQEQGAVPEKIYEILYHRAAKADTLLGEINKCSNSLLSCSSEAYTEINYQIIVSLTQAVDSYFEQKPELPVMPEGDPLPFSSEEIWNGIVMAGSRRTMFLPFLKNLPSLSPCSSPGLSANSLRLKLNYTSSFGSFGTDMGQFSEPAGICVGKDGLIAVTDTKNNRVQIFDAIGCLKLTFGYSDKPGGGLMYPNCVAYCRLTDRYIVTERTPVHQAQIFSSDGRFVKKFGQDLLQFPRGVCVDKDGVIIIIECKVMRINLFDRDGILVRRFTNPSVLNFPISVCCNDSQEIFIADNRRHCIVVFDYNGRFLRTMCDNGSISFPIAIAITSIGEIFVADNHQSFNMSFFTQNGEPLRVYESRNRHLHCLAAVVQNDSRVILSTKDYRIYTYDCK